MPTLPTFVTRNWLYSVDFFSQKGQKTPKWPEKVGKWPLLKTKVGTRKPSVYAGLRALWPLAH
jgi:hypothetical protein